MGPITLIGFMGSGKTTVARYLAGKLELKLIDLDLEIEKAAGLKISKIFKEKGEAYFRELETEALSKLPFGHYVLSLGGGAILAERNSEELQKREPVIFYLKADPVTIKKRLTRSYKSRPLLADTEELEEFIKTTLKGREPVYERVANIVIKTDNLTINQVVDRIIDETNLRGDF